MDTKGSIATIVRDSLEAVGIREIFHADKLTIGNPLVNELRIGLALGSGFVMVPKPHFLLFCDGQSSQNQRNINPHGTEHTSSRGRWRFILEDLEAGTRLEASDAELLAAPERAALLAVVRGLEALEQPSRVTLVTTSRYVSRGLQFGLNEWRESDYCWEHFGSVQPIRNADLWRRIDHAMQFHQVNCRWIAGEEQTSMVVEPIAEHAMSVA